MQEMEQYLLDKINHLNHCVQILQQDNEKLKAKIEDAIEFRGFYCGF
jgi:hypothetical protein